MIKSNNYIILFLLLLTLLLVNYLLSFTFFRVDLSEDQIHELSPYTKDKLENLDDYLKIDVYLVGDFAVEIEKLEKDISCYVYCRTGVRSANSCQLMSELGFKNVYNLLGGIVEWKGEINN